MSVLAKHVKKGVTKRSWCGQIIGVGAAVVGDMSSRPYWGLYELDFVFSTLVVCRPDLAASDSGHWRVDMSPHTAPPHAPVC